MRQRLAGARLLAERPQGVITDDIADALWLMADNQMQRADRTGGRALSMNVGPQLVDSTGRPLQMKMKIEDAPIYAPEDYGSRYTQDGIGIVTGGGGIMDALQNTPLVKEVSFGWDDPKRRAGMSFDKTPDSVVRRQLADVGMSGLLKEAQQEIMGRAGMQSGDLLSANPVGLMDGDLKRATSYMAQGFGAPDASSGQMFARLGGDGSLSPVQLYSAEPELMNGLKWSIDNEKVRRAQALLNPYQ